MELRANTPQWGRDRWVRLSQDGRELDGWTRSMLLSHYRTMRRLGKPAAVARDMVFGAALFAGCDCLSVRREVSHRMCSWCGRAVAPIAVTASEGAGEPVCTYCVRASNRES